MMRWNRVQHLGQRSMRAWRWALSTGLGALLCLFCGLAGALELDLNQAEASWVAQHPVVRVGLTSDFPPYYVQDPQTGQPQGFVMELLNLWAQRSGLRFEYRQLGRMPQVLDALARGEVDMTPFTVPGDTPGAVLHTRPAYQTSLVLVARRDVPDVSPTAGFAGRRLAVDEGSGVSRLVRERYPEATVQAHPDSESALRAVASGQADLFIGYQAVAVYHIQRLFLANLEMRRNLGPGATPLGPAVRPGLPILRSILDKAVASVSLDEQNRLAGRWLPVASLRVPLAAASAQLNASELAWARQNGRLRVGYDASFAPITLRGELGEFSGYGADLLRLVVQKAGLSIEQERGGSFNEVYEAGQRGELDVIVGMVRTPQRRQHYDFVGPFLSLPTVLFTRRDEPVQVAETRDIGLRRLALLKGHFLIPELRTRHPEIQILELDRQDQVLAAVAEGAAEVGLGNLSVVADLMERRFAGKLLLSGVVRDGDSELYLAVPRSAPALTRVLAQGLAAVNDSEQAELRARWMSRDVPGGLRWRDVLQVVVPAAGVLLGFSALLWLNNRRLRAARSQERLARQQAESATAARSRFLAYLAHELRGSLSGVSVGVRMLQERDDPNFRQAMLDAIARSSDGLLDMLEATLRHEQSLQAPLHLAPAPVDLARWWPIAIAPTQLAAQSRGQTLEAQWRGPMPWVLLDGVRLQQVLHNLLTNAVKFTDEGGTVRVHARLSLLGSGQAELLLVVRDDGPGLSPADRALLFQPYAQGEAGLRQRKGAGLGLAISHQIVEAMGGELVAPEQPVGQGARFECRLLLTLAEPPVDPPAGAPTGAPPSVVAQTPGIGPA